MARESNKILLEKVTVTSWGLSFLLAAGWVFTIEAGMSTRSTRAKFLRTTSWVETDEIPGLQTHLFRP